jgi:hypothetical protein
MIFEPASPSPSCRSLPTRRTAVSTSYTCSSLLATLPLKQQLHISKKSQVASPGFETLIVTSSESLFMRLLIILEMRSKGPKILLRNPSKPTDTIVAIQNTTKIVESDATHSLAIAALFPRCTTPCPLFCFPHVILQILYAKIIQRCCLRHQITFLGRVFLTCQNLLEKFVLQNFWASSGNWFHSLSPNQRVWY